jgi:hypothetical protein
MTRTLGWVLAALLAGATMSLPAGCIVVAHPAYEVESEPPAPRYEVVPAERPGYVWVRGYWEWHGRWTWRAGHWERHRGQGYVWNDGYWQRRGNHYHWVEGHWSGGGRGGVEKRDHRDHGNGGVEVRDHR